LAHFGRQNYAWHTAQELPAASAKSEHYVEQLTAEPGNSRLPIQWTKAPIYTGYTRVS